MYSYYNILDDSNGNMNIGGNNTVASPTLKLSGSTSNLLYFNSSGVNPPAYTTRSAGTKIVLYPNITSGAVDYALGIDNSTLWQSIPYVSDNFVWYGGTSVMMALSNYQLGVNTNSPATTIQANGVCSANSFACYSGSTANTNQLFGYQAGNSITSGTKNTAVGYQAGSNLTTGTECVTIGYGANVSTGAASNRIAIGYNASATADNSTFITNIYENSGGGSSQFVTVNSNNQVGSVSSSYIGGSYIGSYSLFTSYPGTGTTTLITITATIPSYGSSWRISGSYYFAVNGNSNGATSFQTYFTATSSSNFAVSENLLINNDSYGMSGSGFTTCPYSPGATVTVTLQCYSASQPVFIQTSAYNCSSYVQLMAIQSS